MLEYLNLFLMCTLFSSNFYLYAWVKRYLPLLKMAEEIFSSYDTHSDTKHQKLLECVFIGNSKLYLGKVYTEDHLAKLSKEEVEIPTTWNDVIMTLSLCLLFFKLSEKLPNLAEIGSRTKTLQEKNFRGENTPLPRVKSSTEFAPKKSVKNASYNIR